MRKGPRCEGTAAAGHGMQIRIMDCEAVGPSMHRGYQARRWAVGRGPPGHSAMRLLHLAVPETVEHKHFTFSILKSIVNRYPLYMVQKVQSPNQHVKNSCSPTPHPPGSPDSFRRSNHHYQIPSGPFGAILCIHKLHLHFAA